MKIEFNIGKNESNFVKNEFDFAKNEFNISKIEFDFGAVHVFLPDVTLCEKASIFNGFSVISYRVFIEF